MLSLSNGGMSSGQAGSYFSREDYYLKGGESSQWLGKTAEELKLKGPVLEVPFKNVVAGKSPDGIRQLVAPKITKDKGGNQVESHRAGNDLTFSAPKSVSIGYAAGNRELKEIWDKAVVHTMRYVEDHYSHYRTPDGLELSGNIVAAKFDHVTSRALDPEVHSHVFLVNMTRTQEGEWKANEPKNVYQDKIALGTLARQEAIHLYRQAGYGIRFTDRETLLFEIEGVSEREMETFSKRSAAIAEKVAQWKEERRFPGVPETILKQMAALDTRDPKRAVTREDVRREWDRGFEAAGTTAEEVRRRIEDSKELHPQPSPSGGGDAELPAAQYPDKVVKLAATILSDKEAVFDRTALLVTAAKVSGGEHSLDVLDRSVEGRHGPKNGLVFFGREGRGWQAGTEFYSTQEMLELEARNLSRLKALGSFASSTRKDEVQAYLAGLAGEGRETLTREEAEHACAFSAGEAAARLHGAVILSAGQREHLINELAGEKGLAVTQGDPGTGKTFVSGVIERYNKEVLEPTGRCHHTVNVAYTGKAALELSEASGRPALTVDAFLIRYGRETAHPSAWEIPREAQVVVKLDEASLVGGRQAERILQVLEEFRSRGHQVKLSLVGDSKQMQSIKASPFFSHAFELACEGHGELSVLKEITRQKERGLLAVAEVLNRDGDSGQLGMNADTALEMLRRQKRVVERPERRELMEAAVEHYLKESRKPAPAHPPAPATSHPAAEQARSVLIITPLNTDRQELNNMVRQGLKRSGELPVGKTIEVLTPVDHGVTASRYQPGMYLVFDGERQDGGLKRQEGAKTRKVKEQGEVIGVDPDNNIVTVRIHRRGSLTDGKGATETRTFEGTELARNVTAYRREEREFAPGDRVVFGKNTRDRSVTPADDGSHEGVRNGEMGQIETVSTVDGCAVAAIRLANGRRVKVELERYGPQHLDHGYAVTVHKGQGDTIDSVIAFHYVKPGTENWANALSHSTGMKIPQEQFENWNSSLTEFEKGYRIETAVVGHPATLSFVAVADRNDPQEHKGIAIQFHNGPAVVKDEPVRFAMREAGMYWSEDRCVWVTGTTNENAMRLLTRHPLRDRDYLAHLREELKEKVPARGTRTAQPDSTALPPPSPAPREEERNYRTEISATADKERFGRASFNAFNVAITRARHEARVFTNSLPGLRKAIRSVDEKTTTVGKTPRDSTQKESTNITLTTPPPRDRQPPVPTAPKHAPVPTVPKLEPTRELEMTLKR